MSSSSAYERVCAELHAVQAARRKGLEILSDLRDWLRGDPRMAREGHAAVLRNDTLQHSYAGRSVLTCSVGDNLIVLEHLCPMTSERKKAEFKLSDVGDVQNRIVQLIARAVDSHVPRTEPASQQPRTAIYPA